MSVADLPTISETMLLMRRWRNVLSALEAAVMETLLRHGAALETGLAAALAVRAELVGHSFVELSDYADRIAGISDPLLEPLRWPELSIWNVALSRCAFVAQAPLAGIAHGKALVCQWPPAAQWHPKARVYLRRLWRSETDLAARLRRHLTDSGGRPDLSELENAAANSLFDGYEWLNSAANALLSKHLCLITGGPGTGKTTSAARLIAFAAGAWHAKYSKLPRIALCAPTGKAAARLGEAFASQLQAILATQSLGSELSESLETLQSKTLHRLLGYQPALDRFRHNETLPLAVDILLVDEASMLSLTLMHALISALTPDTQLIFLGDADQLSAVESGTPFADLLRAATQGGALFGCASELTQQWRANAELSEIAGAIRRGDHSNAALRAACWQAPPETAPSKAATQLLQHLVSTGAWDALFNASSLEEAWQQLNQLRVLCALHEGPAGQIHANSVVESALKRRHRLSASSLHFRGRLVMAIENDYQLGVMNGDVGLCWPDETGELKLWFDARTLASTSANSAGGLAPFEPSLLPKVVSAFAMTVHKSQGSEFASVLLILPEIDMPAVHRAVIYTAATRAKEKLLIYAPLAILEAGIARVLQRNSALCERLLG